MMSVLNAYASKYLCRRTAHAGEFIDINEYIINTLIEKKLSGDIEIERQNY